MMSAVIGGIVHRYEARESHPVQKWKRFPVGLRANGRAHRAHLRRADLGAFALRSFSAAALFDHQ